MRPLGDVETSSYRPIELAFEERPHVRLQVIHGLLEHALEVLPPVPRGLCPAEPVRGGRGRGIEFAGTLRKEHALPRVDMLCHYLITVPAHLLPLPRRDTRRRGNTRRLPPPRRTCSRRRGICICRWSWRRRMRRRMQRRAPRQSSPPTSS